MLTRAHKYIILAGAVLAVVGLILFIPPHPEVCISEKSANWRFTPMQITVTEHGDFKELQDDRLKFVDSCKISWIAPKGTLTDGASIPRLALPITDDRFSREFLKAAVLHDAYCAEANEHVTPDQYHQRSWKEVNRMFFEAMLAGGTEPLKAKVMFAGVWWGLDDWDVIDKDKNKLPSDALTRGFLGSKQWIEENNPSVEKLEAEVDRRVPLLKSLHEQSSAITDALQQKDMAKADKLVREESALLEKELAKSPTDRMLLNFKGDLHKNRAKFYKMSNRIQNVQDELHESETTFEAILKQEPRDPSALSGLGDISIIRGDADRAENYTRKALEIAPRYQGAKRNLDSIKEMREIGPH